MTTKRLFIACPIESSPAHEELQAAWKRASGLLPPDTEIRSEQQFHMTLSFIGEVDLSDHQTSVKVEVMTNLLEMRTRNFRPVPLILGYLGNFPGVLWAGVGGTVEGLDELVLLQKRVGHAVEDSGLSPAGLSFLPHITLGRYDRELTDEFVAALSDSDWPEQLPFELRSVVLYESVREEIPGPGGDGPRRQVRYVPWGGPYPLRKDVDEER